MEKNRHFTLVVIGDNPEELIKPFDRNLEVEPYTLYEFKRAKEYHDSYVASYQALYDLTPDEDRKKEVIKETLDHLKAIDDSDFYLELTEGEELDPETGDLIATENPNGKYDYARLGKDLCVPLIDKEGNEVFTALKKDVDWEKVHMEPEKVKVYQRTWEMVVEGSEPKDENEKIVYEHMKNRTVYFDFWKTKENYVKGSCAFWGYAVVDQNGWVELEDDMSQVEWISNFYDHYIKDLPEDTRISIYECFRK